MSSYKLHCSFTLYSDIVLAHSPSSGQRKLNIAPLIFAGQWWSDFSCIGAYCGDGLLCELDQSGTSIVAM